MFTVLSNKKQKGGVNNHISTKNNLLIFCVGEVNIPMSVFHRYVSHASKNNTDFESVHWDFNDVCSFCKHDWRRLLRRRS